MNDNSSTVNARGTLRKNIDVNRYIKYNNTTYSLLSFEVGPETLLDTGEYYYDKLKYTYALNGDTSSNTYKLVYNICNMTTAKVGIEHATTMRLIYVKDNVNFLPNNNKPWN